MTVDDGDLLARLAAIEAIKQLKARYFRMIDAKLWPEWGQVFARDAVLDVPSGNMLVHGRDAIVAAVSAVLEGTRTVHHGHMPEIEITGTGEAKGIWAMFDFVDYGPGDGNGLAVGLKGYGHYDEDYAIEDGEWRITRSRLNRLRVDPLPGGLPGQHAPLQ